MQILLIMLIVVLLAFSVLLLALAKQSPREKQTEDYGAYMEKISSEEQYQLIRELLEPEFGPMFVTPQDIDERVRRLSFTVSEGIHQALYKEGTNR